MKKKVFLGAYVNYLNAQNINCRSIATHLDKSKYEIKTLFLSDCEDIKLSQVKKIKVSSSSHRFSIFYAFLKGLIWADVAYLPKHQSTPKIALRISKLFGTKIFTTIEGNMCNMNKRSMIDSFNGVNNMKRYFSLIPNIFGITKHIVNNATCGVYLKNNPLYLGVEKDSFFAFKRKRLKNIVFIGSLLRRKRIEEFINLAGFFPSLNFHVIGNKKFVKISRKKVKFHEKLLDYDSHNKKQVMDLPKNIYFHGKIEREDLPEKLKEMDLHFLPSKSEGFPKVILETAASSIPSILYDSYGASEWIDHKKNGFLVKRFEEVISTIQLLLDDVNLFIKNSEGSLKLADNYDWKNRIRDWEKVIDNLK